MAYPTLTELKAFCSVSGSTDDTILTEILNGVIDLCKTHTSREFVAAASVKEFDRENIRGLYLLGDLPDLVTVTSITNGDGQVIPLALIQTQPFQAPHNALSIRKNKGYVWQDQPNLIQVNGLWGYSADVPNAIRLSILIQSKAMYQQRLTGSAVAAATPGGVFLAPEVELVPSVAVTWRRHSRL